MQRKHYLYIGIFLVAVFAGYLLVIWANKAEPEDLAPETKPIIVTG